MWHGNNPANPNPNRMAEAIPPTLTVPLGDYLNMACTWAVYGKASKTGVIPALSKTDCNGVVDANYYFLQCIRVAARFAAIKGIKGDHLKFSTAADQIKASLNHAFVVVPSGDLMALTTSNATQTLVSLMLTAEVLNATDRVRYATALLNDFNSQEDSCLLYKCAPKWRSFSGGMTGFKAPSTLTLTLHPNPNPIRRRRTKRCRAWSASTRCSRRLPALPGHAEIIHSSSEMFKY
jgi:hypothetical protein